jgi:hypothetical protein
LSAIGARFDISSMIMRSLRVPLFLSVLLVACRGSTRDDGAAADPSAAASLPDATSLPLDQLLEMLQKELDGVFENGKSEEDATARLIRAEELTDRLLDSRIPFEWLSAEQYSVDARLRQIQALADRVLAQIRIREPWTSILADARVLRDSVERLRAELAAGGSAAPPQLEELLTTADSAAGARPAPPPRDTLN